MNTKAEHVANAPNDDHTHHCHARGCVRQVKPAQFMCTRHWFTVPMRQRKEIWRLYRPGQEVTKNPSPEYLAAAIKAIESVAKIEAQKRAKPTVTQPDLLS